MFSNHITYVILAYIFAFFSILILFLSSILISKKNSKLIEKYKKKND